MRYAVGFLFSMPDVAPVLLFGGHIDTTLEETDVFHLEFISHSFCGGR